MKLSWAMSWALGVIGHEAADDGADPVLVLEHQQVECRLVATLYTFDQFQVEFVLAHPGRCSLRPVGPLSMTCRAKRQKVPFSREPDLGASPAGRIDRARAPPDDTCFALLQRMEAPMFDGLRLVHWKHDRRNDGFLVLTLDRADENVNALVARGDRRT